MQKPRPIDQPSYLPLVSDDNDLNPLLWNASNEDLAPLVDYILGKDGWRTSSELELTEIYKKNVGDHRAYALEIASEIQNYGGNTISNLWRGHGVKYREVVADIADFLKVPFNPTDDVAAIEQNIQSVFLGQMFEKMSDEEKREILKELGLRIKPSGVLTGSTVTAAAEVAFQTGGFASYKMAALIANAVAQKVLGSGLHFTANAGLMEGLAVLAGPVGLALNGVWLAYDLSKPATRVTIPCVLHVAYLRKKQKDGNKQ